MITSLNALLLIAAILALLLGVAHSYLGERYILVRLFRRSDLPKLFGSDWLTRRTLRFGWHLTTVAFWGFVAILLLAGGSSGTGFRQHVLMAVAVTFFVSSVIALAATGWWQTAAVCDGVCDAGR